MTGTDDDGPIVPPLLRKGNQSAMPNQPYGVTETLFTWSAPPIKFGVGAVQELAFEVQSRRWRTCLVLTDERVAKTEFFAVVQEVLSRSGTVVTIYDRVAVEPTDRSVVAAAEETAGEAWDGYVAVGGGSVLDTAKLVNLLHTNGASLLDWIAPPVGQGRQPEAPLRPLIAVPTTAGTGSEATAIAVVDLLDLRLKAGVSHPALRPTLAVVDPSVTLTLPPEVTAACGMDVLTHAIESFTARPYHARPPFSSPGQRIGFTGSNPISDLFCERAIRLTSRYLRQAVWEGWNLEARSGMMLAAMFAGIGFGNAGTHIPHANAYPVAGQVHDYHAPGYPEMPMVPHGQAVASTAIPAFRFTFPACPDRHLLAASWVTGRDVDPALQAEALPAALRQLMRDIAIPRSIGAFGFTERDVEALAGGTLKQQRQLSVAPRQLTFESAVRIFRESLQEE